MPLERSNALPDLSDPNIIIGPWKRQPTECLLENRDPLACKKVKKNLKDLENVEKHTLLSMPPPAPTHVAHAMPAMQAMQATHSAESTNDRVCDEVEAIMVEDTDKEKTHGADEGSVQDDEGATTNEDDNSEMRMCPITLI